jgi:hypothetical protein
MLLSALRSTFPPPSADRSLVKRRLNRYPLAVAFDREKMKRKAAELAAKGVFIGTSSWKYQLCRDRHNPYFHEDVPTKNPIGGEFRQRLFHLLSVECQRG